MLKLRLTDGGIPSWNILLLLVVCVFSDALVNDYLYIDGEGFRAGVSAMASAAASGWARRARDLPSRLGLGRADFAFLKSCSHNEELLSRLLLFVIDRLCLLSYVMFGRVFTIQRFKRMLLIQRDFDPILFYFFSQFSMYLFIDFGWRIRNTWFTKGV